MPSQDLGSLTAATDPASGELRVGRAARRHHTPAAAAAASGGEYGSTAAAAAATATAAEWWGDEDDGAASAPTGAELACLPLAERLRWRAGAAAAGCLSGLGGGCCCGCCGACCGCGGGGGVFCGPGARGAAWHGWVLRPLVGRRAIHRVRCWPVAAPSLTTEWPPRITRARGWALHAPLCYWIGLITL
jgi:hypothetical protein